MSKEDKIVFCTGGGCTAKLGAGVLSRILEKLPRGEKDPDLLVGYDSRDDAAVHTGVKFQHLHLTGLGINLYFGSAEYRKHLAGVLTKRAVLELEQRKMQEEK